MRRRSLLALGALVLLVLHGCPSSGARLTVRVQSGLRAGDELRHLRAFLRRGGSCMEGDELASEGLPLERTDQRALGEGSLTVAELGPLEPGLYALLLLARRPGATGAESGAVLIERCVITTITNDRVLRIALTTGCVGVTCPAPGGSAAFTECLNARCVDPRCDPDDPVTAPHCCDRALLGDACDTEPTLCRDAHDCELVTDCAADPRCENGACIEPAEDLCDDGQHCDVTMRACVPDDPAVFADAGPADAGAPEDVGLDSGSVSDAFLTFDASLTPDAYFECRTVSDCRDDGDVCTEVACALGLCETTTVPCDDGVACTLDACSSVSGCQHVPDSSRCAVGATCHPTRGCEPADACAGVAECDDGLFCTTDACTAMRCTNTARTCALDSSACTTTTCDETADACVHPFDPTSLTAPTHCGTSAAMCTAPCPARGNADATCSAGACGFACRAGFVNLDGSAANGCEYACTFTSSSDPADTSALDANCDGADGVVGSPNFIYVTVSGASTGSGSTPATAVNLARAFTVAAGRGSPVTMLLVTGTYPISTPLSATSGLTMMGGYQDTTFRTRATNSRIRSTDPIAMRVSVPATLDSVDFLTADQAVVGEYTRTLWVTSSTALVLRNLTVTAGRGAPGALGALVAAGAGGAVGAAGTNGSAGSGGPGGGSGPGRGGAGAGPPGAVGMTAPMGPCSAGGAGGNLLIGVCSCSSTVSAQPGLTGMPGCTGMTGGHGTSGSGAGTLSMSGWTGPSSTGGTPGATGADGSGGGGGASADCPLGSAGGGGGGAGGAGGRGGFGGEPGTGGAGSFAIVAQSSRLTMTNVTLVTGGGGGGGQGGSGGAGGAGGVGGPGGAGGSRNICGSGVVHGGSGGQGGVGGAGGPGGCGAGGVGGPSIGLLGSAITIDAGATVTYSIGDGGLGGDACVSPPGGAVGDDGVMLNQLLL